MQTRTCTKCKAEKPATLDYFYKGGGRADGLTSWCKDCMGYLSKSRPYIPRNERIPNEGESQAVSWLRSHGIPANGGKNIQAVSWLDVLAWGCVRIEVKFSKTNKQGLWSWMMYSVNNKKADEMPHLILFIGKDIRLEKYRFFLFQSDHDELFNPRTGERKVNVTYNYRSDNAVNHDIFLAHEDKTALIEEYRLKISEALKG